MKTIRRAMGPVCLSLFLAGCATSRDFKSPAPPSASGYMASGLPARTAVPSTAQGGEQRFVEGSPIITQWWQAFGSPQLDALIKQAQEANPSLEAAEATLRQARHTTEARAGSTRYLQANANLGGRRQAATGAASGQPNGENTFNLFNASVNVQYNFDLFGGNRRAIEALAAQAEFQSFQLEGARLALAANVAVSAIAQARIAGQIEAAESILSAQAEQLALTRQRLALGGASQHEVLALQTQMEQTRADIPALRNELDQATHLLAALIGQTPSAATLPRFALDDFTLPSELPLQVPSELVRQRPDIRASEALLQAAHAQYGVALSKLYPQITLSADMGSQALTADKLFSAGSLIWAIAGQVAQPLFNRGLRAEARAAEAGADAAAAYYRETVLQAFRNVADVLSALDQDAQALAAHAAAAVAAQESLELVRQQHALGAASYLELLTAQQQAEATHMDLYAARAQRLMDTVAFYAAMGGGRLNHDGAAQEGVKNRTPPAGEEAQK
ncbi:MAG TPA: RND transporter [Verrucomicrobia bacterium]|nr:RND transporter [Verrucomicrobiota bacterium]